MLFGIATRLIATGAILSFAGASSPAATTRPPARAVSPLRPALALMGRPQRGPRPSITGCSTVGTGAFVGGGGTLNTANIAAGQDSRVLEGDSNVVCDKAAAIGAGSTNTIFSGSPNSDKADESFIGAGFMNTIAGSLSFVGAGISNNVSSFDSFVGSGGGNGVSSDDSFVGAGNGNSVSAPDSFIGAGLSNVVSSDHSFVGAGGSNTIPGLYSFIGAGQSNTASGHFSFIGAGDGSTVAAEQAFIGGSFQNLITPLNGSTTESFGAFYGVIGGGFQNTIQALVSGGAEYGVVGGGRQNKVTGLLATIGGGYANLATSGYASVPGGDQNTAAGIASFAAGTKSQALHAGTFVWSDDASGAKPLKSTATNQFLVRASGGVKVFSNPALTAGVTLAPGSGSWASLSDRAAKTAVVPIDGAAILERVAALPIDEWRYKAEDARVRHVGPMAQDFYAAFGVGEDDRHITSIDEDGVALAAIKALNARTNRELAAQRRAVGSLRQLVQALLRNDRELTRRDREVTARLAALQRSGDAP